MKYKLLTLAFLFLPIYTISSAQTTSQISTSTMENSSTESAVSNTTNMQEAKEVRIISSIEQIDQNEIKMADAILNKTTNSDVKEFANKMKSNHQENLKNAQDLAKSLNLTMTTSPKAVILEKKGEENLKALESKQGKELDIAFVNTMVKGHTDVLAMLDKHLKNLSSDANADFVNFMKDTKKMVSDHLDEAKDLQTKLQNTQ